VRPKLQFKQLLDKKRIFQYCTPRGGAQRPTLNTPHAQPQYHDWLGAASAAATADVAGGVGKFAEDCQ